DWSSDVCSSDLVPGGTVRPDHGGHAGCAGHTQGTAGLQPGALCQRIGRGPRQAGPDHDPARPARVRGAGPGLRRDRRQHAPRDLGLRRLGCVPGGAGGRLLHGVRGGTARGAVSGTGLIRCRVLGEVSTRAWGITLAGVTSPAPGDVRARASRGWGPGREHTGPRTQAGRGKGGPMGGAAAGHLPVMVEEVLDLFAPALQPTGAILVDATLGRAGHARALLDAHPGLVLIGVDTDRQAIEESRRLLAPYA